MIIDIPKQTYKEIKNHNITHCGEEYAQKLIRYIKKGVSLDKVESGGMIEPQESEG